MGTYTALAKNSSSSDEWFTNDYEPTAADHGPDVLYEIARDQICAFRWKTDSDEFYKLLQAGLCKRARPWTG